jgi:hypothetical protein
MREQLVENIAWQRQGARASLLGALRAGDDGIRLSGRDPASGLEVNLSIPWPELAGVRVSETGDEFPGSERCLVLELARSKAILLRELGARPLGLPVLARRLGGLIDAKPSSKEDGGVRSSRPLASRRRP